MDSVTQFALGASVGEAVLGKKIGNKAILWGGIAGTIPDLDVLISPLLNTVQELSFHRSITHSILFCFILSPILGRLIHKKWYAQTTTQKEWTKLFFLGFLTHALLDACTTWGTQLLYPFLDYGFASSTISIVDPFYTLPLLIGLTATLRLKKDAGKRSYPNYIGLFISTLYLAFSFYNQTTSHEVFEKALAKKGISYSHLITKPTPMNNILWTGIAKTDKGYYTGYYSLLDNDKEVKLDFTPSAHDLLDEIPRTEKLEKFLYITKGYYTLEKQENQLLINDIRFGKFNGWQSQKTGDFVFTYNIIEKGGEVFFERKKLKYRPTKDDMLSFWERIKGEQ